MNSDTIKVGQLLKLKDVIELYWSYGDETGDYVDAVVEYDTETGLQQFTVIGVIASNGIATIKNVFNGSEQIITGV